MREVIRPTEEEIQNDILELRKIAPGMEEEYYRRQNEMILILSKDTIDLDGIKELVDMDLEEYEFLSHHPFMDTRLDAQMRYAGALGKKRVLDKNML